MKGTKHVRVCVLNGWRWCGIRCNGNPTHIFHSIWLHFIIIIFRLRAPFFHFSALHCFYINFGIVLRTAHVNEYFYWLLLHRYRFQLFGSWFFFLYVFTRIRVSNAPTTYVCICGVCLNVVFIVWNSFGHRARSEIYGLFVHSYVYVFCLN